MKYIYIVYKEEDLSVFESQVLQLLNKLKNKYSKDVLLIVVKNRKTNEKELKNKIETYIGSTYKIIRDKNPIYYKKWKSLITNEFLKYNRFGILEDEEVVIHARSCKAAVLGNELKKYIDKSIVIFDNRGIPIEEIDLMIKSEKELKNKIKLFASRCFFKKCLREASLKSDMYSFVTNNLREFLIKKYDYSIHKEYLVIPTCVKIDNVKQNNINYHNRAERYIYVGSNDCWQNSELVLRLFKILEESNPIRSFMILSKDYKEFLSLNEKYKIRNIEFKCVNHVDVIKYLKLCGYGIIIRDDSIVNKVSSPTKLVEYLSQGLKVIYSGDIGVIDDILNIYGDSIKKSLISLDEIDINSIGNIIEDSVLGTEYLEYFSWNKNIEKLLSKIEKVLG